MTKIKYILKEAGYGLFWALILTALVLSPGVLNNSADFIYANF